MQQKPHNGRWLILYAVYLDFYCSYTLYEVITQHMWGESKPLLSETITFIAFTKFLLNRCFTIKCQNISKMMQNKTERDKTSPTIPLLYIKINKILWLKSAENENYRLIKRREKLVTEFYVLECYSLDKILIK